MTLIRSPRTTRASQSRPAAGMWSTAPWRSEITRTLTPPSVVHRRPGRQTHAGVGFADVPPGCAVRLRAHARGLPQDGGGPARCLYGNPEPDRGRIADRGARGRASHRPCGERGRPSRGDLVRHVVTLDHSAYSRTITVTEENLGVLGELKRRGLRLGLVSNVALLPDLMLDDLKALGILQFLDAATFSSEVG